jgi:hypothetical protein
MAREPEPKAQLSKAPVGGKGIVTEPPATGPKRSNTIGRARAEPLE